MRCTDKFCSEYSTVKLKLEIFWIKDRHLKYEYDEFECVQIDFRDQNIN